MIKGFFYKGKHRTPSNSTKRVAAVVAAASLPMLAATGTAEAAPPSGWGPIIECESGGNNVKNAHSSASGYFQIIDGTWKAHGGLEFAKRAMDATYEEQLAVANRIYERRGSLADWNASKHCWSGKTGSPDVKETPKKSPEQKAPKHALAEPTLGTDGSYEVKPGDTLTNIAIANNVNWESLYEKNRDVVEDPNLIFPGERLKI